MQTHKSPVTRFKNNSSTYPQEDDLNVSESLSGRDFDGLEPSPEVLALLQGWNIYVN